MQRFLSAALAALALVACENKRPTEISGGSEAEAARAAAPSTPTVIASGLEFPRGFTFGRDGAIYLAEAGTPEGNTKSTVGQCEQTPPPVGPWKGGYTGRVSRITMSGARTMVLDRLPSAINGLGDVDGVADVAFADKKMYVLIAAGCGRGLTEFPSSVIRVKENGKWKREVNLSAWIRHHPVAHPEEDDFEPDGDWYSMASDGNLLFLVEANQGNLVAVRPDGKKIRRVADVSATENGHVVPTGLAIARHDLLVGELTPFPAVVGAANVIRYDRSGHVEGRMGGFTAILGVAHDWLGNTYVLEAFTCGARPSCFPSPGSGDVVRVKRDGTRDIVAAGLSFPTTVRLGPDGALYVSNFGFGPPHSGQILRFTL